VPACPQIDKYDFQCCMLELGALGQPPGVATRDAARSAWQGSSTDSLLSLHTAQCGLAALASFAAAARSDAGSQAAVDAAFRLADRTGRGVCSFAQLLVWYGSYLRGHRGEQQQQQQKWKG
jgi:hypothetical protein